MQSNKVWGRGIADWFDGQTSALETLVKNPEIEIPDFAREFLSDLVSGNVDKGKGGRPPERDGWVERSIVCEVFAEWEKASKSEACATVAERRGMADGAVRGLVDKYQQGGITKAKWIAWGRPKMGR